MNNEFVKPEMEIVYFDENDIIASSLPPCVDTTSFSDMNCSQGAVAVTPGCNDVALYM